MSDPKKLRNTLYTTRFIYGSTHAALTAVACRSPAPRMQHCPKPNFDFALDARLRRTTRTPSRTAPAPTAPVARAAQPRWCCRSLYNCSTIHVPQILDQYTTLKYHWRQVSAKSSVAPHVAALPTSSRRCAQAPCHAWSTHQGAISCITDLAHNSASTQSLHSPVTDNVHRGQLRNSWLAFFTSLGWVVGIQGRCLDPAWVSSLV